MRKRINLIALVLLVAVPTAIFAGPSVLQTVGLTSEERSGFESIGSRTFDLRDAILEIRDCPDLEPKFRDDVEAMLKSTKRIRELMNEILEEDNKRKRGELPNDKSTR